MVNSQQGGALLISLIFLVIMTLLVTSGIRSSTTNLRIAGNRQVQAEATAAAQQAIEQIISSVNIFYQPITARVPQTIRVDINNDGNTDYDVVIAAPLCLMTQPAPGYSYVFSASGSAPQNTYWDIRATVTDARTGATVILHQGVRVILDVGTAC